jgi:hypothetical protein
VLFLAREPSLAGDKQPATAERIPWIASEGSESMASWFDFLRIEAGIAMSFIDSARLHSNPANSARSVENARKALAEIRRGLMDSAASAHHQSRRDDD